MSNNSLVTRPTFTSPDVIYQVLFSDWEWFYKCPHFQCCFYLIFDLTSFLHEPRIWRYLWHFFLRKNGENHARYFSLSPLFDVDVTIPADCSVFRVSGWFWQDRGRDTTPAPTLASLRLRSGLAGRRGATPAASERSAWNIVCGERKEICIFDWRDSLHLMLIFILDIYLEIK